MNHADHINLTQQLVHRIFDIAAEISANDGPRTSVAYDSNTNNLHITLKNQWSEPPFFDEVIELPHITDSEFTHIRVERKLLEIVKKLATYARPIPAPAA